MVPSLGIERELEERRTKRNLKKVKFSLGFQNPSLNLGHNQTTNQKFF